MFTQKHNNPPRFEAVGGWERQHSVSAEGSTVFRKRKEFNCAKKINPKAAAYKGLRGPGERLQESAGELSRGGNSITGPREHRGFGLFSNISGVFNSRGALPVCLDTNAGRNNLTLGIWCCFSFYCEMIHIWDFLCFQVHCVSWKALTSLPTEKNQSAKQWVCLRSPQVKQKVGTSFGLLQARLQPDEQTVINSCDSSTESAKKNILFYYFFVGVKGRRWASRPAALSCRKREIKQLFAFC